MEGDAVVAAAHHLLGLGGQREDGGLPRHLSHNNQVIHPDTFNKIHSYRLIHADIFKKDTMTKIIFLVAL